MNREDREVVDNFYSVGSGSGSGRPPQNLRDASGSSQSQTRAGAWGSNSTGYSIPPPGQRQSHANRSGNPYTSRMKDNLSSQKHNFGNPTAKQTVVPSRRTSDSCEDPPSKRRKTESSHFSQNRAITNTAVPSRGHRAYQRVINKPGSRTSLPDGAEVTIIDDDEDAGVPIPRANAPASSPDPLMLGKDSSVFAPASRPLRSAAHPFDVDDPMISRPSHIKESNVVQQLRQRGDERKRKAEVNEVSDSETDGIEQFDDDMKAGSSKRETGDVKNKVKMFEDKGKKVLYVDLASVNKHREHKPVAGNMKPRSNVPKQTGKGALSGLKFKKLTSVNQGFDDHDALSAPSLGKSSRNNTAEKVTDLMLPLEAWSLGLQMYPEDDAQPYHDFLCWDEKSSVVTIARRPTGSSLFALEKIMVNNQVADVQVTNRSPKLPECVVIKMTSRKYPRRSTSLQGSERFYSPGSKRPDGLLTFKFPRGGNEWSDTRYQKLVTFLKKQAPSSTVVDGNGAIAIWSKAQDAAQYKKMEVAREDVEAAQPSTRRSSAQSSAQSDVVPTTDSRPKPRPAFKGANGSTPVLSEPVRGSTRQPSSRKSLSIDPDELILVYPPSGTGAINITQADLNRLEEGEYLNDTLIEFGLKLWLNEIRATDPELADQIHVFSSFFYKKLKNNTKNPEEGYQSVRKWTQKFDLFKKKYLIIPINEHLHWYLAIIYQPEHVLLSPPPTIASPSVSTRSRKNQSDIAEKQLKSSTTSDPSPIPQDQIEDTSASHLPCSSSTGNEGGVEEMFDRSCSISMDHSRPTSTASSSTADQNDREGPEAESIVVDDDGVLHELQYPSPDTTTSQMDVDELAGDEAMDDGTTHETSMTSSKPVSRDASSGAANEKSHSISSSSSAVVATSFYSSAPTKGKEKEKAGLRPRPFPLNIVDVSCSDDGEQDEVDELLNEPESSDQPTTYIFTLDSLGSKHPQAIKFLSAYLKMEAKDKKNIVDCSNPRGFQAFVPVQHNFCDCGLYLLHLAKTFLKRPEHHCHVILSRSKKSMMERQIEWDGVDAREFRAKFKAQVIELSQAWKKDYAAKQAQKGEGGDKQESSDSEVDIVEDTTQNTKSAPSKQTKAARIRG